MAGSRFFCGYAFSNDAMIGREYLEGSALLYYIAASAAICPANVVTNDLSPVISLISEYAPDLEEERGERITAAAV